jgi:hypothetical protein
MSSARVPWLHFWHDVRLSVIVLIRCRLLLASSAVVVAVLLGGLMYFQKMETRVADAV